MLDSLRKSDKVESSDILAAASCGVTWRLPAGLVVLSLGSELSLGLEAPLAGGSDARLSSKFEKGPVDAFVLAHSSLRSLTEGRRS